MVDREKVVEGIQCQLELKCNKCPYTSDDDVCDDCDSLFRDVLELLKEKEEEIESLKQTCQSMMEGAYLLKEREAVVHPEPSCEMTYITDCCCDLCGVQLIREDKFCRCCGKRIEWEGR